MSARVWRNWNTHSLLVGMENSMTILKAFCQFFFKLKIYLPYDSAIPPLIIHTPQKRKAYNHTKTCTQMLIITLFEIVKNRKQSKGTATDEWIDKLWHIHTMEIYSAIKVKELFIPTEAWWDPRIIMLNKRRQARKSTCYVSSYIKF